MNKEEAEEHTESCELEVCRATAAPRSAFSLLLSVPLRHSIQPLQRESWTLNTTPLALPTAAAAQLIPEMPDALRADNLGTSQHLTQGPGKGEEGPGRGWGRQDRQTCAHMNASPFASF